VLGAVVGALATAQATAPAPRPDTHAGALIAVVDPEGGMSKEAASSSTPAAAAAVPAPPFVATHEWQEIGQGQAIPPGLHVQIDMQTGKKSARLLPVSEQEDAAGAHRNSNTLGADPAAAERRFRDSIAAIADEPAANTSRLSPHEAEQLSEHMRKLWEELMVDEGEVVRLRSSHCPSRSRKQVLTLAMLCAGRRGAQPACVRHGCPAVISSI
jgi:hypothetical protein